MKLDTAEAVLEWAGPWGEDFSADEHAEFMRVNTATAERLAFAMRVLAIVEREAECDGELFVRDILAEASKEGGK